MKTPKEYESNIKNRIITYEMLAKCIYSVNKRAKNYRDRESDIRNQRRSNRFFTDYYDSEEKYRDMKIKYYEYKDTLLQLVKPKVVHYEVFYKRIRYYDYEEKFNLLPESEVVYSGSYFDRDTKEEIEFKDVCEKRRRYFLLYEIAGYSFHLPLKEGEEENYSSLDCYNIDNFITKGKDVNELISMQFVKKVIKLIESNNYLLE